MGLGLGWEARGGGGMRRAGGLCVWGRDGGERGVCMGWEGERWEEGDRKARFALQCT